jgi:hypothetical protein
MALLEKHRSVIYAHFVETIGEEAAQAMLAQFPARDLDEPVTKEFVRAEIADIRAEMADVRAEIAELRGKMHTEFARVREEMGGIGQRLAVRLQVTIGLAVGFLSAVTLITR